MGRNNFIIMGLLVFSIILALAGGCTRAEGVSSPQGTASSPAASPAQPEASQSTASPVQTIAAGDAFSLIQKNKGNADFIILDVRTPGEFSEGHIAGAVNIDFNAPDFRSNVSKLDRNKQYLVYCSTGVRSAAASQTMAELGFQQIYNLASGITQWIQDGYPTER